jgi:hypothetical protein
VTDDLDDVSVLRRELQGVFAELDKRFTLLEQMQEATDQQMGMIVAAYAEIAAMCDALSVIMRHSDPEIAERFDEELASSRKRMLSVLERINQSVEDGSTTTS